MVVRWKRLYPPVLLGATLISAASAASQTSIGGSSAQSEELAARQGELRKVIRIIDGDTIVVSPNEKVRLIGVNTPETKDPKKPVECFGRHAEQYTRDAVEGKIIRLVLDKANFKRRHKDPYRRTLAYAYLEDGTMLNRELIRGGYAYAEIRFPFHYLVEFRELERQAKTQSLGLWSSCFVTDKR
jgi:micrococcal nuclease